MKKTDLKIQKDVLLLIERGKKKTKGKEIELNERLSRESSTS